MGSVILVKRLILTGMESETVSVYDLSTETAVSQFFVYWEFTVFVYKI